MAAIPVVEGLQRFARTLQNGGEELSRPRTVGERDLPRPNSAPATLRPSSSESKKVFRILGDGSGSLASLADPHGASMITIADGAESINVTVPYSGSTRASSSSRAAEGAAQMAGTFSGSASSSTPRGHSCMLPPLLPQRPSTTNVDMEAKVCPRRRIRLACDRPSSQALRQPSANASLPVASRCGQDAAAASAAAAGKADDDNGHDAAAAMEEKQKQAWLEEQQHLRFASVELDAELKKMLETPLLLSARRDQEDLLNMIDDGERALKRWTESTWEELADLKRRFGAVIRNSHHCSADRLEVIYHGIERSIERFKSHRREDFDEVTVQIEDFREDPLMALLARAEAWVLEPSVLDMPSRPDTQVQSPAAHSANPDATLLPQECFSTLPKSLGPQQRTWAASLRLPTPDRRNENVEARAEAAEETNREEEADEELTTLRSRLAGVDRELASLKTSVGTSTPALADGDIPAATATATGTSISGPYGGWSAFEHKIFLKVFNAASLSLTPAVLDKLKAKLPTPRSEEQLLEHADWTSREEALLAERRHILLKYKERKQELADEAAARRAAREAEQRRCSSEARACRESSRRQRRSEVEEWRAARQQQQRQQDLEEAQREKDRAEAEKIALAAKLRRQRAAVQDWRRCRSQEEATTAAAAAAAACAPPRARGRPEAGLEAKRQVSGTSRINARTGEDTGRQRPRSNSAPNGTAARLGCPWEQASTCIENTSGKKTKACSLNKKRQQQQQQQQQWQRPVQEGQAVETAAALSPDSVEGEASAPPCIAAPALGAVDFLTPSVVLSRPPSPVPLQEGCCSWEESREWGTATAAAVAAVSGTARAGPPPAEATQEQDPCFSASSNREESESKQEEGGSCVVETCASARQKSLETHLARVMRAANRVF